MKENFLCRSAFKGATKLTKEDIERVFTLYDRVSQPVYKFINKKTFSISRIRMEPLRMKNLKDS